MKVLQFPFDIREFDKFIIKRDLISLDYGEIYKGLYTEKNPHRGIDYALPFGTDILAAHDGFVQFAGVDKTGFGLLIAIRFHNDESGTLYAHLSDIFVKAGDTVKAGQYIGKSGATGNVTGPHLHFEYRRVLFQYKTHEDPNPLLPNIDGLINKILNKAESSSLTKGTAKIVCNYAYYRDESLINRIGGLPKNSEVELTGRKNTLNNLVFHEAVIQQKVWIAEADGDGVQILSQTR